MKVIAWIIAIAFLVALWFEHFGDVPVNEMTLIIAILTAFFAWAIWVVKGGDNEIWVTGGWCLSIAIVSITHCTLKESASEDAVVLKQIETCIEKLPVRGSIVKEDIIIYCAYDKRWGKVSVTKTKPR